jgi:hypothetical protein
MNTTFIVLANLLDYWRQLTGLEQGLAVGLLWLTLWTVYKIFYCGFAWHRRAQRAARWEPIETITQRRLREHLEELRRQARKDHLEIFSDRD